MVKLTFRGREPQVGKKHHRANDGLLVLTWEHISRKYANLDNIFKTGDSRNIAQATFSAAPLLLRHHCPEDV